MNRNRSVTITSLLALAILGGGVLYFQQREIVPPASAQGSTSAQGPAAAPPVAVQTTRSGRRNVARLISLPGDATPWQEATLYAKVPGYLGSITVDKGDRVKAGQVVATIEAPELQADRDQAQHSYQSAQAQAQGSRATTERTAAEVARAQAEEEKAKADALQAAPLIAKAKAQLVQAQSAVRQAELAQQETQASLEESQSQVQKAQADLETARSGEQLATITYDRYRGIYEKNSQLIAKQDVDTAEAGARSAHSKTAAAQSALQSAQSHIKAVQAQVGSAAAKVEQAKAQVLADQEQVGIAQAQAAALEKQAAVVARDLTISRKQQEVAQANQQQTRFQAEAGRSALGKSASIADYARIRAPFNGMVTRRFVDPGAFIQTASASQSAAQIVTVSDLDRIRLYVHVPEVEAHFIRVGTPVKVTTTSMPKSPLMGRVARTSGSLDTKTRTLLAEVDLPNHDGQILPGTYAMTKVVLETHNNVIGVPSPAVGSDKSGKFVFVVENGKAKRVVVTTGFDDGAYTEIQTGLQGGEEIIVTGRDNLTPNAAVQATPWSPPAK
jgi:RND family efflux transporter MFP subunit